jgi:peptidyl-prolyl cis-trans isomerase C
VATVNGVALHSAGEQLSPDELRERAYAELLRQEAVRQGRLPAMSVDVSPELSDDQRQVIEAMLDEAIDTPEPTPEACERYYTANKVQFVEGLAMHVRPILFAVTPGVNVHALAQRAETALLELSRKEVAPNRFETLARELSNCPTGANGGDLGWIGPNDCAPELANELFYQSNRLGGQGVHPLLVHTRYGFHIIEVLARRHGRQQPFEDVHERIRRQLTLQSRATAWRQYMLLLVGQAELTHLVLEGADSPLVQ